MRLVIVIETPYTPIKEVIRWYNSTFYPTRYHRIAHLIAVSSHLVSCTALMIEEMLLQLLRDVISPNLRIRQG